METGICTFCEEVFPLDELTDVGSQLLCEGCEEDALICERCGEPLLSDENSGTDSFALCLSCRNALCY